MIFDLSMSFVSPRAEKNGEATFDPRQANKLIKTVYDRNSGAYGHLLPYKAPIMGVDNRIRIIVAGTSTRAVYLIEEANKVFISRISFLGSMLLEK
jgi:hypothetical protein